MVKSLKLKKTKNNEMKSKLSLFEKVLFNVSLTGYISNLQVHQLTYQISKCTSLLEPTRQLHISNENTRS